jgi:Xaa-Pro dipeptidase
MADRSAPEPGYDRRPRFEHERLPACFCNLDRLFKVMEVRGVDGLVSSFRRNVFYLSGFSGNPANDDTQPTGVIVISRHHPDHPIAIVPEAYASYFWVQPSWITDIRPYAGAFIDFSSEDFGSLDPFIPIRARQTDLIRHERQHYSKNRTVAVVSALKELGLDRGRVGFDEPRFAPSVAGSAVEPFDAYGALKHVRSVKTEAEVSLLRAAFAINQAAIESTVSNWTQGTTWNELNHMYNTRAVNLGGFVRDPGGLAIMNDEDSDPMVAISHHQGLEEDYVIQPGTAMMFDCHGSRNQYCWDGGKTWYVSDDIPADSRRVATAAGNGMIAALENMKPGLRISQLQTIARQAIAKTGVSRPEDVLVFFHGVGLDHNELETPEGSEWDAQGRYDWVLERGMVIAPHFAFPGDPKQRYYYEETAVVTDHGGDPFSTWGVAPLLNPK